MISIACLIYRSIEYLRFVKRGVERNTPMLRSGEAEFYFVCNNATEEVKNYLKENDIPHYVFETEPQPPYAYNIGYIYRAWNFAVKVAKGDVVVLLNSDMYPAKGWLEALVGWLDERRVITSRLVESGRLPSTLPHVIVRDFGRSPKEFRESEFEEYAAKVKLPVLKSGGAYMPLAIHRSVFMLAGGYPHGNIGGIPGDKIFFERLSSLGVEHYTAFDSICYHIQEGESSEVKK